MGVIERKTQQAQATKIQQNNAEIQLKAQKTAFEGTNPQMEQRSLFRKQLAKHKTQELKL